MDLRKLVPEINGRKITHDLLSSILQTQPKCCAKCAFRSGSPERDDSWNWCRMVEGFEFGMPFLCHEGIPGHESEKEGVGLVLCAGRAAMEGKPMLHLGFAATRTADRPHGDE